ncbi:hypothetical protein COV81_04305 [Candidatus Peregrinibacteria bacterium CG11_big_fil_rev_8_21_14_0_20_41_10]|nr:MAG: hypothetical protein COV81_04305 [Candidatus Peregrinibacteria bacterium CG11_big_fil_rev_8_21_14_0_20_41_10]PIZ74559.1 MAG: hypothetical protein COY06_04090 [Candidatus Peregrinibacteria bacterium CG_4_10_14_0_2_um_filter_41_8]PJC37845.1 MAG: hypothetical protein CO045_03215 [Candidatus Peregrinibacteria bacterium CG_4_9_14_0_2_um_filter_41_14]
MIKAIVEKGLGVGAKELVPTLNLSPLKEVCWPHGVYACRVEIADNWYNGVLHWGPKGNGEPGRNYLEVNVFDFAQDVYGMEVKLEFRGFIREVRKFENLLDLKAQIQQDIAAANQLL